MNISSAQNKIKIEFINYCKSTKNFEDLVRSIIDDRVLGEGKKFNQQNAYKIKLIEYLIFEKGLSPNIQSKKDGMTATMFAISSGRAENNGKRQVVLGEQKPSDHLPVAAFIHGQH